MRHDADAERDPVVAILEARVDRLEQAVHDHDGRLEAAEHAVVAAQLRAARRALAEYTTPE